MQQSSQFDLLKKPRFGPFFVTQFLGAFNDNVFKNALILYITFQVSLELDTNLLVNLSAGLFILPFFLFSALAGEIADKFEKSRLIRGIKLLEIFIMIAGACAFLFESVPMLLAVLFLMGTQSSFFGPIKYGILPQHLRTTELVGGNALVGGGTFLAILLGTIVGGIFIDIDQYGRWLVSATVIAVAILGWRSSFKIPAAEATDQSNPPDWNLARQFSRIMHYTTENRTVFLAILGISWFWFYGAILLAQFPNYTRTILGGDESVATLLLAAFSIGIGLGALVCERLSRHQIELGLVPLGAVGLSLFAYHLGLAQPTPVSATLTISSFFSYPENWRIFIDLLLIAFSGGMYIVPLSALVQSRTRPAHRSRVIAGNNIINAIAVVLSAVIAIAALAAGLTIPQLFILVSSLNILVAIFIFTQVPEFIMRLIVWLLVHTIYRIDNDNLKHIPDQGAAVLVSNHVSYTDAPIISSVVSRPVRFVMHKRLYDMPILNFVYRTAKAIPIANPRTDIDTLKNAYDSIDQALKQGELVCIFPEGKLTTDGEINRFKNGIEKIIRRTPAPVVPIAIRGMWDSLFSRKSGHWLRRFPGKLWSKVTVVSAPAVAAKDVKSESLQKIVQQLRLDQR